MSSVASTPQRLGVVRDELALEPLGPRRDDDLLPGGDGDPVVVGGDRRAARGQVPDASSSRQGTSTPVGTSGVAAGQRLVELVDAVQQVAELEAPEHLLQLRAVGRREHELGRVEVELEVAAHRRELLRGARLLGVLADRLRAGRRQLVDVLEHLLERAVLRDQLAGGLVADPGNAGDVVGGVALEPDEVRHLLGLDPEPQLDALGRVDVDVGDAARGHHQRDVVGDELEGVAVGRDDRRLDPGLVGAVRERGDHVVGLPALELEVAVAEGLDDRPEVRELLPQQVRHRLALDLVGLEQLGPVHGPRVPGDGDALRPVVGEQLEEHVREAEQRVRREALARRQLLRQRVEGAVGEVVAVDEEELGVARGAVVELQLGSGERLRRHLCESTSRGRARDRPLRRRASRRRGGPARGPSRPPPRGRAAAAGAREIRARRSSANGARRAPRASSRVARTLLAAPLDVRGTTWMRGGIAGQAIEGDREPMRDLYASRPRAGSTRAHTRTPPSSRRTTPSSSTPGSGSRSAPRQSSRCVKPGRAVEPFDAGVEIRRGTAEDFDEAARLDLEMTEAMPSTELLRAPARRHRQEIATEWREELSRARRAVRRRAGRPDRRPAAALPPTSRPARRVEPASTWRRPSTAPEARGSGVGRALTGTRSPGPHEQRLPGDDDRLARDEPLASRFWPRRGFRAASCGSTGRSPSDAARPAALRHPPDGRRRARRRRSCCVRRRRASRSPTCAPPSATRSASRSPATRSRRS